jgi:hypothetical protein
MIFLAVKDSYAFGKRKLKGAFLMTKNQKIFSPTTKLTYLALIMIILLIYCNTSFSADNINDRVIKSFREDPEISNEIDKHKRQGFYEGNINIVGIGGVCGVAGCNRTLLVIQSLISSGANPQTISVMAEISLSPFNEVDSVKMVMLVPFGRIRMEPRIQSNPTLLPEQRIPPPNPVLSPENPIPSPDPIPRKR